MQLKFTEEEWAYINEESDLVFTQVGLELVDGFIIGDQYYVVDASESDKEEFIRELKGEYVRLSLREASTPKALNQLVQHFLQFI